VNLSAPTSHKTSHDHHVRRRDQPRHSLMACAFAMAITAGVGWLFGISV
jgi:hypothetical protein